MKRRDMIKKIFMAVLILGIAFFIAQPSVLAADENRELEPEEEEPIEESAEEAEDKEIISEAPEGLSESEDSEDSEIRVYAEKDIQTLADHEHEMEEIEARDATCTEEGNRACWYCTVCEQYFADEAGEEEISWDDVVIPALGHDWGWSDTVFSKTDSREIDIRFECLRCNDTREETLLVETVGIGIEAHSTLTWNDVISAQELGDLFEDGAEVDLDLDLEKYKESDVPSADKNLIEDKITELWPESDFTAVYLDISVNMYLTHADGREEKRTFDETLQPIEITMTIPEELLNADGGDIRVLRVHDQKAEVIDSTQADGTLTFSSDKFSTYALVKTRDAAKASMPDSENPGDDGEPEEEGDEREEDFSETDEVDEASSAGTVKTADDSPFLWWLMMMFLGAAGVIAAVSMKVRAGHVQK